jgi:hypothetical protein
MAAAKQLELCECGRGPKERQRGKHSSLMGCRECNAVDGKTPQEREIIHLLRMQDTVTIEGVASEIGVSYDAACQSLSRMVKRGYLERCVDPNRYKQGQHNPASYYRLSTRRLSAFAASVRRDWQHHRHTASNPKVKGT